LGSNLNDPLAQVRRGLRALAALPRTRLIRASSCYCNPPEGGLEQPPFVNAVAEIETGLAPRQLLDALLEVERRQGRVRSSPNAPRTLDLDIILYGAERVREPELEIPHPRMHGRAFVLAPLAEIAPDAGVPGHGRAADLLRGLDVSGLTRLSQDAIQQDGQDSRGSTD
jgi:2-amino-4-hydroxy-6-hydroxymethyldihydropteridine diphosphokinase